MNNKVSNPLPTPEQCDACASFNIVLTTNKVIYGKDYGDWPKCFYCNDCRAMVGCHPGTDIPLGTMANATTRRLRAQAHKVFDVLWKGRTMSRTDAYKWLAAQLGIEVEKCHISWLNNEQLNQAIDAAGRFNTEQQHIIERRKEKKRAKATKQSDRVRRKISIRKSD